LFTIHEKNHQQDLHPHFDNDCDPRIVLNVEWRSVKNETQDKYDPQEGEHSALYTASYCYMVQELSLIKQYFLLLWPQKSFTFKIGYIVPCTSECII